MELENLRNTVSEYGTNENGLEELLRDFEAACLRYLAVRSDHIYKKYTNKPVELIAEADQSRTRAHDNLISCYRGLMRNINKYVEHPFAVLEDRKGIGETGLQYALQLLLKM